MSGTPLGRLLEEISWEGNARGYRQGGRGRENVLVAEVFHLLDLLPRELFLGEILKSAHGANVARESAAAEAEAAHVDVLPGGPDLYPDGPNIQPDVYLRAPSSTVVIEAKRIRSSSFQPDQLAREYLTLMRDHTTETRLLLLVLGAPPPVLVSGAGHLEIGAAIRERLPVVHGQAAEPPPLTDLLARIDASYAWTTWSEISAAVTGAAERLPPLPAGVSSAVQRAAHGVVEAIQWHG